MAELNLIPYELKKKKQDKIKFKDYIAYIVLFVCITFSAVYFPLMRLNSLRTTETNLKAEVLKNAPIAAETARLNKEILNIKTHMLTVEALTKQKVMANTAIKGLEIYIPSDVIVSNLIYQKDSISITARSSNYNSLCIFVANLQTSKEYPTAKLIAINSSADKASVYNCTILIAKQGVK